VIGIGQLPVAPRPTTVRRRTLPYTIRRPRRGSAARSSRAPVEPAVNNVDMLFDQPPAELPVATLRPRESGAQLLLDVRGWLAARWRWLRPRAIPVAVAFAGMLGVLASARYLRELAHQPPQQLPGPALAAPSLDEPMARVRFEAHTCVPRTARPVLAATVVPRGEAASAAAQLAPVPAVPRSRLAPVVAPAHAPAR
jgi:hypothetical protein